MTTKSIPIAQVIQHLRHELSTAMAEGDGQDLRFTLGPVELEFEVEVSGSVSGEVEAEGGIQIGVISIGKVSGKAGTERSGARTHTIKLTLTPELLTEEGGTTSHVRISDADVSLTELPQG